MFDKVVFNTICNHIKSRSHAIAGLYFEQLEARQNFRHDIRRTVTETDYLLFSTLTHNPVAIHLDAEYAKTTEFGRPLMNSVFTSGSMVGIFVGDTKLGKAIAALLEDLNSPGVFPPRNRRQNDLFTGVMCHREFRPDQDV